MVLERAEILVKPGTAEEFAAGMNGQGLALLRGLEGCVSAQMGRGVENPDKFMMLVEWDSIDAHNAARAFPDFASFRALIAPYGVGGSMEHFAMG